MVSAFLMKSMEVNNENDKSRFFELMSRTGTMPIRQRMRQRFRPALEDGQAAYHSSTHRTTHLD
jgi:hypothetical protein